jgi:hypothetical protein
MTDTNLRRGAGAAAGLGAAFLGGLPLLISRGLPPLEGGLALAASITGLAALILTPSLLPPAIALYGAELVVSVHRSELAVWSIPLLAAGLLLVYEAGELRHQLPSGSVIEPGAVLALTRRIGLTAALGFSARPPWSLPPARRAAEGRRQRSSAAWPLQPQSFSSGSSRPRHGSMMRLDAAGKGRARACLKRSRYPRGDREESRSTLRGRSSPRGSPSFRRAL